MMLLFVEDDVETGLEVRRTLEEQGHDVDHAGSGPEGLAAATSRTYDVVIVDRMLPGFDGLVLVKALRRGGLSTPVIFLTAMAGVGDRVEGLEAGGDDYLVKPFALVELVARINALGRRPVTTPVLRVGDLHMDLVSRQVRRADKVIELQPREFRLLQFLMANAGRLVTRTMLLESVWDLHFDPRTNIVETHMSRVRSKVDKPFACDMITTVRGSGYIIRAPS